MKEKVREYHLVEVPYYVIVDRRTPTDDWNLVGYQYTPLRYLPIPPDDQGRLWLEPAGMWLAAEGQMVALYDGKTNQKFATYAGLSKSVEDQTARAEQECARADAEAKARQEADARIKELEAELARLKKQ